jgi:hypothetical protein
MKDLGYTERTVCAVGNRLLIAFDRANAMRAVDTDDKSGSELAKCQIRGVSARRIFLRPAARSAAG